ncbi:MAG TPA: hypothetical protein VFT62_11445 [Mycobacteriales bacterium]|nr:hypothetical protein [Mycobacteriales bacterium]
MSDRNRWRAGDDGQTTLIFLGSLAAIVVLSGLLAYGAYATYDISAKAGRTATANAQIDAQTLPLEQLPHANAVAASILETTRQINQNLSVVLDQSRRSEQLSGDIVSITTDTRGLVQRGAALSTNILTLNRQIAGTSSDISHVAASILNVNQRVRQDVAAINGNLARTIAIAHQIKSDTGNILQQTHRTLHLNACIDREAHGPAYQAPACSGGGR